MNFLARLREIEAQKVVAVPPLEETTIVYTDGGCVARRYFMGAFAWRARMPGGGLMMNSRAYVDTTNNRMELMAIRDALETLEAGPPLLVVSDSQYCVNGLTKWMYGWQRNGWVTADGNPVANRDLWERMPALVAKHKVRFKHVKGHSGNPDNEYVDQVCSKEIENLFGRWAKGEKVPYDTRARPMKAEKIVEFLAAVGVNNANRFKRTGWVVSECPLGPWKHENGKSSSEVFGVKIEDGDPSCNCFACDFHGTLGSLVQRMVGLNKKYPRVEVKFGKANQLVWEAEETQEFDFDIPGIEEVLASKREPLHEFPDWWLEGFPCAWDVGWARSYLQSRNVPLSVAAKLDILCDPNEKRLCFPVRGFDKKLYGLHGRAVEPDVDPRYRMYTQAGKNNPIVWLGEDWVDLTKPIVVVEGPFDLASVYRVYENVVSPLFSNPALDKIRRMSDALEWVTFYDRGAGGDAGRDKVDKALGADHVVHHLHPPKGRKDPGEMTAKEIADLLVSAVTLTALFP